MGDDEALWQELVENNFQQVLDFSGQIVARRKSSIVIFEMVRREMG